MRPVNVLIVDDDRSQAESLRRVLALEGFTARAAGSPREALEEAARAAPDAVVSDFRMGEMTGLDLYRKLKERQPDLLYILVTGYGTLETAVEALKSGVHDFLQKPVDPDELVIKIRKALSFRKLEEENRVLKKQIATLGGELRIIGESPAIRRILGTVEQVADSAASVLVQGESGTGKELIARAIHLKSRRSAGPYVKVNCASIPENLLESELFGHEAGAFTGAVGRRIGRFESASGGTIFLDEIGETPLHLQPKLLRVLQEREFERVGGNETIEVDVRVVAATNRDLSAMVREGAFREDLFYRLDVIRILIPPLRERMDDVIPLANHFVNKYGEKNGRSIAPLSPAAREHLLSYGWPGNVRELENCIERAVVLSRGDTLTPADLIYFGESRAGGLESAFELLAGTDLSLDELEKRMILLALERSQGNVSGAARLLKITRRSLQYRLDKIREEEAEPRSPEGRND